MERKKSIAIEKIFAQSKNGRSKSTDAKLLSLANPKLHWLRPL